MSTVLYIEPKGKVLLPLTEYDERTIGNLPRREFKATLVSANPRSVKQNAFYWSILGKTVENQEHYKRAEELHSWLKRKLGYYTVMTGHDGIKMIKEDSTSFDKMDSVAFKQFLDGALDVIVADIIPGMKKKELVNEVESMLGYTYDSLWVP